MNPTDADDDQSQSRFQEPAPTEEPQIAAAGAPLLLPDPEQPATPDPENDPTLQPVEYGPVTRSKKFDRMAFFLLYLFTLLLFIAIAAGGMYLVGRTLQHIAK